MGILFKGDIKEGEYRLIKTTNGWVLDGKDISYVGDDVVRCKDCIENSRNCDGDENWCFKFGYDVEDDDFCSYGEREGE